MPDTRPPANETPSLVACIDYIRVWDSLKFDFVNE